MFDILENYELQ